MSQIPPPPGGTSGTGRVGEIRAPMTVALLALVTCGIYGLYWYFKSFEEMKNYSGEGLGGAMGLILSVICGILTIFILPSEVANLYKADNRESPVSAATGLWNLIPLLGYFIFISKVQGALNDFWASKGAVAA
jgi:Domain of unknown function (DUF4234)